MPAYVIAETDISDPARYEQYKAASPDAIAAGGGRFLVRGGEMAVLEGDWQPKRLVVLEFPSMQKLLGWYRSAEYAPLIKLRQRASRGKLVAVEGA